MHCCNSQCNEYTAQIEHYCFHVPCTFQPSSRGTLHQMALSHDTPYSATVRQCSVAQTGFGKGVSGDPRDQNALRQNIFFFLAVLCVRIKFLWRHSPLIIPPLRARSQSVAATFQKFPDSLFKSVSTAGHRQERCVWRNDQLIDRFAVSR